MHKRLKSFLDNAKGIILLCPQSVSKFAKNLVIGLFAHKPFCFVLTFCFRYVTVPNTTIFIIVQLQVIIILDIQFLFQNETHQVKSEHEHLNSKLLLLKTEKETLEDKLREISDQLTATGDEKEKFEKRSEKLEREKTEVEEKSKEQENKINEFLKLQVGLFF